MRSPLARLPTSGDTSGGAGARPASHRQAGPFSGNRQDPRVDMIHGEAIVVAEELS
jgi:hypothetical protein